MVLYHQHRICTTKCFYTVRAHSQVTQDSSGLDIPRRLHKDSLYMVDPCMHIPNHVFFLRVVTRLFARAVDLKDGGPKSNVLHVASKISVKG